MVWMVLLPLLFTLVTGVCPLSFEKICVKAGEMVPLFCKNGDGKTIWKSDTNQRTHLHNMSAAEQRQMGVVVEGNSLVILNASVHHQGNYSCSVGNASSQSWFGLTVDTPMYNDLCYTQQSCTLNCREENAPPASFDIIGTTWRKEDGEPLPEDVSAYSAFSIVKEKDSGVYICTRSYLYDGQIYNMTTTVVLHVRQRQKSQRAPVITSPRESVIQVELGKPKAIKCEADTDSCSDSLFWLSGESFVTETNSSEVFYNVTCNSTTERTIITAFLNFKEVKASLLTAYTCKLESSHDYSKVFTITLIEKARPSNISLALCIGIIVVVMVVTVVIYVRFKVEITLFLRDTINCSGTTSDGKSYDAFLLCYTSDTDAGLNEDARKWLESVLEERFGYSLILYDRDVLPGTVAAEAVLDCVEQSRAVVLVPTSSDAGLGSGLLSAIHAALVERQTRLVFIDTKRTEVSRSGSIPEALQLLSKAGHCVTWKGTSSMPPSSSFWKQLRYYLRAPQHASKKHSSPLTNQGVTPC